MGKGIIEKTVEAPAKVLEEAVDESKKVISAVTGNKPARKLKEYWQILGPGLTTGAADDDPSGIATYSQIGAGYGFKFIWLAGFTFPLMAVVQEMCARIGLVTGRGLAGNIRKFFPKWVLILCTVLLFVANTFNIGADLGAMSEVIRLFYPTWNYFYLIVAVSVVIIILEVFVSYRQYSKYLKWLSLVLFSYILSTLLIKGLNWGDIGLAAIHPVFGFSKDEILIVTGALGTTISPYLFFWQPSQEIEEHGQGKGMMEADNKMQNKFIKDMRIDVWSGMFLSNLVMFFIIAACAATLNANGITTIGTAAEAARALRPLAGDYSYFLFAIGIIGVGLLGIPILAGSSSYALAESFGWRQGLHYKLRQAYAFYGVIIISISIGVLLNLFGLDPIKALIYSAILNGCIAPVVMILILILSSSEKIMGRWKSGFPSKAVGIIATALMTTAGIATIWSIFG